MSRTIEQPSLWRNELPPEIDTRFLYWQKPYGWRVGDHFRAPGASAADVIRYERDVLGNQEMDTPEFLLEELDRSGQGARDVIWVCRTKKDASQYVRRGSGQPYRVDFAEQALILAMDSAPQTGYLLLFDASVLAQPVIVRYALYRKQSPFQRFA